MARRQITGLQYREGGKKWRAAIRVHGTLHVSAWGTEPLEDLRKWREDQIEKYGGAQDTAGGLAAAVAIYLTRKTSRPTYDQIAAHLALWVQALGRDRPPLSVTAKELDVIMEEWLETLKPATVRKRRSALRTFYARTYPARVNPVKGSQNPKPPKPEIRDMGYPALEAAIAAMPDQRDTKPGLPGRVSLSKLRARVIAYTGIPPGLLKTIQPHDLVLTGAGSVRVKGREKGEGVEPRTLELTAEGLAAFKAFHAAHAYGPFTTRCLNESFKRGCKRAGLDPKRVHLYDARHTFLAQVYRVTRDLATVGRLGLHAEGSTATAVYARGANQAVDQAAVAAFSAALATQRQQGLKAASLPRTVTKRRKSFRRTRLKAVV